MRPSHQNKKELHKKQSDLKVIEKNRDLGLGNPKSFEWLSKPMVPQHG